MNLSEAEARICRATGITPEQFSATKRATNNTAGGRTAASIDPATGLTPDELEMCKRTGVTPAAFLAAKKDEGK